MLDFKAPYKACSAFTRVAARTLALSPIRDTLIEGFSHFVTSMTAPIASGWSGCRVGLAPTGKRRLSTAHAKSGRSTNFILNSGERANVCLRRQRSESCPVRHLPARKRSTSSAFVAKARGWHRRQAMRRPFVEPRSLATRAFDRVERGGRSPVRAIGRLSQGPKRDACRSRPTIGFCALRRHCRFHTNL